MTQIGETRGFKDGALAVYGSVGAGSCARCRKMTRWVLGTSFCCDPCLTQLIEAGIEPTKTDWEFMEVSPDA